VFENIYSLFFSDKIYLEKKKKSWWMEENLCPFSR